MKFTTSKIMFKEIESKPLKKMTSDEYDKLSEEANKRIREYQLQQRRIVKTAISRGE